MRSNDTHVPTRCFEYGNPLHEVSYGQVNLAPGLHQTQLEETHAVLMSLDEDSLLRPHRLRAGLPATGCDLGGWYSNARFAGETFGQWVSALSRYCAITSDEPTRAKVDRLVRGFAQTIEPPACYGPTAYPYDKLTCGLMDAHQFAGQPIALEVLAHATVAAEPHLPGRALDELREGGGHESYCVPENQFIAWQRGGDPRHLTMARQYLHEPFFSALASGENDLAGRHAYSHVNALCSAVKAYLVLGDERYLRAAKNGLAFVEAQSFATGGWGPNETFLPIPATTADTSHVLWPAPAIATLGESLAQTHWHFETSCGSYAHFKLTRYLLRITKDPAYGDSMERVMYNTVLGAKPLLQDGRAFYNSDYSPDGHKRYYDGDGGALPSQWPCCSGTLPQVAADYRICSYLHDTQGIYVNLYIPSTLRWKQGGVRISLTQSGTYPLGDRVSFVLDLSQPATFAVRLRIPAWSKTPIIDINGKQVSTQVEPGTFATLKREWRPGDCIELELPRQLELKAVDAEHPDTVALMSGPLSLFAITYSQPKVTREQLLAARRKDAQAADWEVDASEGVLKLKPFWEIKDERYSLYLKAL